MFESADVQTIETVAKALHRLHVLIAIAMGDETDPIAHCEQCYTQARVAVGALEGVAV